MKILLDYFIFDAAAIGGVYRYFLNLIKQAENLPDIRYQVACLFGENEQDGKMLGLLPKPFHHSESRIVHAASDKFSKASNILYSLIRMAGTDYDILHPTYYSLYYKQVVNRIKKPLAVTVYDMIHERYPQFMQKGNTTSEKKKLLCEKADIIFAISQHTKTDLVEMLNIPPDKIKVTWLAGGFTSSTANESFIGKLPGKYLLFVGGRAGYKNFSLFFKAIAPLLHSDPDLHLVCTGGRFTPGELNLFKEYGLEQRVNAFFVDDRDFYTLYNKAEAFIFPSLYEGFGIPVLEAFSCGCPVVASNCSSLPEVGGDAALYFDPNSEAEMRDTIAKLIYNPLLKKDLIDRGFSRIKLFSWNRTSHETIKGYHSIL